MNIFVPAKNATVSIINSIKMTSLIVFTFYILYSSTKVTGDDAIYTSCIVVN